MDSEEFERIMQHSIVVSSSEHTDHKLQLKPSVEGPTKSYDHRSSVAGLHEFYKSICRFPFAKQFIDNCGFGSIFQIHFPKQQDNCLTNGLFERWWHTTGTFHFPSFEIGFTPLDFTQITGIPIGRGMRITLTPISKEEINEMAPATIDCLLPYIQAKLRGKKRKGAHSIPVEGIQEVREEDKLVLRPKVIDRCNGIRETLLQAFIEDRLSQENDALMQEQIARWFILWMIGHVFFPNRNSVVDTRWLRIVRDLGTLKQYDWGSAIYAHMLRGLSTGVTCSVPNLVFFSFPLMPWFWAYFRCLFPYTSGVNEDMDPWPAGRLYDGSQRKSGKHAQSDSGTHSLITVRNQIDNFGFDCVCWNPWEESRWAYIPEVQEAKTMSKTSMVFYDPYGNNVLYLGERCIIQTLGLTVIPRDPPNSIVDTPNAYLYQNPVMNTLHFNQVSNEQYKIWWRKKSVGKYRGVIVHEGNRDIYGTQDNDAYARRPPPHLRSTYTDDLLPVEHRLFPHPPPDTTSKIWGENNEATFPRIGQEYLGMFPKHNHDVSLGTTEMWRDSSEGYEQKYHALQDEYVALTQAYIEAQNNMVDGAVVANVPSYWSNVFEHFDNISGNPNARSKKTLQARWGKLSREILTFVTIQAEVNIRNPGWTYEQKTSAARLDYLNRTRDNFLHDQCYEILKAVYPHFNPDDM